MDLAEISKELKYDGDTYELPDGRILRLKVVPDEHTSIHDDESFGQLDWGTRDPWSGRNQRPDHFDGNAEIIERDRDTLWWQPPVDVKRDDPNFNDLRNSVMDLVRYGYVGIVLELCEGEDFYGKPIVKDSQSLWGIGAMDTDYFSEVAHELLCEMDLEGGN